MFEETGLRIGDPGQAVMTRRFEWDFEGARYDQHETYFVVRTEPFTPASAGSSETEQATMVGHKWWSIEELRHTDEVVFPEGLAELLHRLVGP